MKAELVPENGDPPIPITRDLTVVGRRPCCDVVIDHHGLSKRHCVLVKTEGLLVVRDLISTNGTKVKGQKIRWAALLPDDRLTLGSYKVRVYLGSDEAPSPSERANGKTNPATA
ncbi:FHA domain-containing protein, partial [Singulisphaera rosea]